MKFKRGSIPIFAPITLMISISTVRVNFDRRAQDSPLLETKLTLTFWFGEEIQKIQFFIDIIS